MTTARLSVACMGLGRIGAGIALSVQRAGHRLIVYNRTAEKTRGFVASGAEAARSPREAAAEADIVVTCLMDDTSVRDNLVGENGILAGMRPGAIHIGTSTVTPKATAEFAALHAAHGSHYLAATFVGHPEQAAAGKLISFVAGSRALIERCRPVLDAYTGHMIVVGEEPALAASFKLTMNFFVACLLEAMGEALVFAEKQGVNLEAVSEMMKGALQHPVFVPKYLDKIRLGNFRGSRGLYAGRRGLEGHSIDFADRCGVWRAAAVRQRGARQDHRRAGSQLGELRLVCADGDFQSECGLGPATGEGQNGVTVQ